MSNDAWPALFVCCGGCPAHQRAQCEHDARCLKDPRWKGPTTAQELEDYTDCMNAAIFYHRRERKRHQETLDRLEPVFDRLVRLQEKTTKR